MFSKKKYDELPLSPHKEVTISLKLLSAQMPYLAFIKISDANISLLNSIEEKLSPKVKKSRYGKKFIAFLESRREKKLNE